MKDVKGLVENECDVFLSSITSLSGVLLIGIVWLISDIFKILENPHQGICFMEGIKIANMDENA